MFKVSGSLESVSSFERSSGDKFRDKIERSVKSSALLGPLTFFRLPKYLIHACNDCLILTVS